VRQFGGTVVQCTDKGLLACYGFPVAYEDAAGRAARSGRAILDAMKLSDEQMDRRNTLKLDPWVGIHTGAAVVESKAGAVSLVGRHGTSPSGSKTWPSPGRSSARDQPPPVPGTV
jgi:class 3 adenylate cyclase